MMAKAVANKWSSRYCAVFTPAILRAGLPVIKVCPNQQLCAEECATIHGEDLYCYARARGVSSWRKAVRAYADNFAGPARPLELT